jgi:hypothetical protein
MDFALTIMQPCEGLAMRRHLIWYALAFFWAAIAMVALVRHRPGNAALEGAVALLFVLMGLAVRRRDAAAAARYTGSRPR